MISRWVPCWISQNGNPESLTLLPHHRLTLGNSWALSLCAIIFFRVTSGHSFQSPFPSLHAPCSPLLLSTADPGSLLAAPGVACFQWLLLSHNWQHFPRFCPWIFFSQLPSLGRCLPNICLCFNLLSKVLVPHFYTCIYWGKIPNHLPDWSSASPMIKISYSH